MKKIFLGTLVIVFALTLSACGNKAKDNGQVEGGDKVPAKTDVVKGDNGGVINSIKDAMGLGKKMECTYTEVVDGKETKSVTQIDGKNFKATSEVNGKKMYSVMKDEVMYTWGEALPAASKLALSCIEELSKNLPKAEGQVTPSPVEKPEDAFKDAKNVSCVPVSSIDVSVPTDVNFVDQCEMMKGLANQLKDMKVPSGANIPNIPGVPELE